MNVQTIVNSVSVAVDFAESLVTLASCFIDTEALVKIMLGVASSSVIAFVSAIIGFVNFKEGTLAILDAVDVLSSWLSDAQSSILFEQVEDLLCLEFAYYSLNLYF